MERISEDVKVLSSASVSVFLDYAQVFNTVVTLLISICTLVYVANRAYQVIRDIWREHKK